MRTANAEPQPRPFSLVWYLAIVFGLSWPFQIVSTIWGKSLLTAYALNATSMVMVTVGTYIAGRYGFRDSLGVVFTTAQMVSLWASAVIVLLGIVFLWKGDWHSLGGEIAPPTGGQSAST